MSQGTHRALRAAGIALAGLVAAAGVLATAAYLLVATRAGTALLVPRVLDAVNGAIRGRVEAGSVTVRPTGAVEVKDVRILDPEGRVVIAADRARARIDLLALRGRVVAVDAEVERPAVVLAPAEGGGLTIAQAFESRTPPKPDEPRGESRWTIRLGRAVVRDGAVEWLDERGERRLAVSGIELDGSAVTSSAGTEAGVRLAGAMQAPLERELTVDAAASLRGGVIEVGRLRASVGESSLDAVGAWDLASSAGRAAIRSVAVNAADLRRVVEASPLASDVEGELFAEAKDGVAEIAFDLAQAGTDGRVTGAAALRLSAPLALGFDLDTARLDPAGIAEAAPAGEVTLHASGRLRGTDPDTLTAALAVEAAPSILRGVRLGRVALRGSASGGRYQVSALDGAVPGARVRGSASWARSGAISADAALEASDLAAAARAVERLGGVGLPKLSGRATLGAKLAGTTRAPRATFDLAAGRLALAGVRASSLHLRGDVSGTPSRPRGWAAGSVGALVAGGEVFRALDVAASIDDRAVDARVKAVALRVGPDPLALAARGALGRNWQTLDLSALSIAWPEAEYRLAAPARIWFEGPRVDRLELVSGATRIAVEGGLSREPARRRRAARTVADARLTVTGLDLATMPRELLPPSLGVAGVVELEARVSGPLAAPELAVHAEAAGGAVHGLRGLSLVADGAWDGAARRARIDARVLRDEGGVAELEAEIPTALLRARRTEAVDVSLRAQGLPLDEAARIAGREGEFSGFADLDVEFGGTVGEPALAGSVALRDFRYTTHGPYELDLRLDAPGDSAQVDLAVAAGGLKATATASAPLDLERFLRDPARGARALLEAPLEGQAEAQEFDLARAAGRLGLPRDLTGRMRGGAEIGGTVRAPRGSVGIEATGISAYGYEDAALQAALLLSDDATGVAGSVAVGGVEVVQLSGFLGLPVERLATSGRIESVPLLVDVIVPDADLATAGGQVPLAGRLDGRLRANGSLQQPQVDLVLDGKGVRVAGKPLGEVAVRGRAAGTSLNADVRVEAAAGGVLTASLEATSEISLAAVRRGDLASAPAQLRVVADRLDLGVLPALLPGTIRSAGGVFAADVKASGPLSSLRPLGEVRVEDGRVAIAEMGEWSAIALDASLTEDDFRVERLHAERGKGTLDGTVQATGLAGIWAAEPKPAELAAELKFRKLTIASAGQDLATLDFTATAKGTFDAERLEAEVTIPRGTVELPERLPREVQSLERRDDIVIVSSFEEEPEQEEEVVDRGRPYRATVGVLLPNRFFVVSPNPEMNIELSADATFDLIRGKLYAEGTVEVIRGHMEPIGGRTFIIERGRLTFTGGPPDDAVIDAVAHYENPSADVTLSVSGSTSAPVVKMTSDPPMDESEIAMLIATGRTQPKAGSGGVGTLTGEEAGRAALGAVATQIFKNVVADKLPVDSVALSSTEIRAGKYVTDKIYVGYTRNFEAQPEEGENVSEVRVEYQITPRWTLESRYGDARTGGASLIWSKDY